MPSDPVTPERWPDDVRLTVNAEPEDGRGDYDIWHTGGPGGPWLTAISKEAAMSVIAVVDEVHELRAALAERDEDYRRVVSETCAGDEKHCACVPHLWRRIRELEERVTNLDNDAGRGEPPRPGWAYYDSVREWQHHERMLWVCYDCDGNGRWAWGVGNGGSRGHTDTAREAMAVAWDSIFGVSGG